MGIFKNTVKDTISNMSGCAMLVVLGLPFAIWASHTEKKKAVEEYVQFEAKADAESCRIEQNRTEDDALNQCRNASLLWGKDISGDMTQMSICLENRENTLRRCAADHATVNPTTEPKAKPLTQMQMDAFMSVVRRCPAANRQQCVETELKNLPREDYEAVMAVLSPTR